MSPLTLAQVAEHNTTSSCWVIIRNKAYDVTDFIFNHPGGPQVIMDYAGTDATAAFVPIHPSDTLDKYLPREKHLGTLDEASIQELRAASQSKGKSRDELRVEEAVKNLPPLGRMINIQDVEETAKKVLPYKAMAYYASAADDSISYVENARAFSRFFFHPRVMKAVSGVDPSTTMLGYKSSIPIYISGSALARLGHPLGEANLTRGAYKSGILQMVSSNSSLSYAQIAAARGSPGQPLLFQLYKHKNDDIAARRIREVEELGYKAIFLTVDALVPSNRELDNRAPHYLEEYENQGKITHREAADQSGDVNLFGTAGGLIVNNDLDMTWERTIPWIRSVTKLPIVVKGIQCVEDAVLAVEAGCEGIVLSNHGGRQLDYSLPPMEVLYKIRCKRPDVFAKTEVYIDGGVRRGTDVLKALCLGARMVGVGRAFLYAQSAYGEAGVVHLVHILEREIKFAMASLGVRAVDQLVPELVERVDWQPLSPKL
ncbi:FMN-dependent dehydrogenase-domain-containing protein [Pisolithus marmoratus]|nr:FMN-dependent dehydrogenase-domain-containing protein [Pisolithus marmoratus]